MTYNVYGGMLNLALSIYLLSTSFLAGAVNSLLPITLWHDCATCEY